MKKLLSLLVLVPFLMEAQNVSSIAKSLPPGTFTIPVISHTNYGGTVGDTTGFFSIKDLEEVGVLIKATDTVDYVIAVDYQNSITGGTTGNRTLGAYTDSINVQLGVAATDTINLKAFYLRGPAGDRIIGADLIRFRLIPSTAVSTKNGIRSGRKYIVYLTGRKQSKAF